MLEFQITSEQIATDELLTPDKLNRMVRPTVSATGTVESTNVADQAITTAKLEEGVYAFHHGAMSGVANVYTATMDPPITAYADGQLFTLEVLTANTGAATLAVDGLATPRKICKFTYGTTDTALVDVDDGDLIANSPVLLLYLASVNVGVGAFVLLNAPAKSAVLHGIADTAVENTYTIFVDGPIPVAAATLTGRIITFKTPASLPNTGACTLTIKTVTGAGGLSALPLKILGRDPVAGELPINRVVWCYYDGTNCEILNGNRKSYQATIAWATVTTAAAPATYTALHGLGAVPNEVHLALICTADDATPGYVIGDQVRIPAHARDGSYYHIWFDNTNMNIRYTGAAQQIPKKAGTSGNFLEAITAAKWSLMVRATL